MERDPVPSVSVTRTEANLARLQNDYDRNKEMFERNLISAEAFERVKLDMESQKATLELAKRNVTNSTILGLPPLCIGTTQIGGDGPPYVPMAWVIVGGLAFSTIVSMISLPACYFWLDDLRNWSSRIFGDVKVVSDL